MTVILVILILICVGFFGWVYTQQKKRDNKPSKEEGKPLFRTEEDLDEYGKSMNPPSVDFDDAE